MRRRSAAGLISILGDALVALERRSWSSRVSRSAAAQDFEGLKVGERTGGGLTFGAICSLRNLRPLHELHRRRKSRRTECRKPLTTTTSARHPQ